MEKQYFESFDNKKIPYLFFESKRERYKNNIVILNLQNFWLLMDIMYLLWKFVAMAN